jgi:hypothetical protein
LQSTTPVAQGTPELHALTKIEMSSSFIISDPDSP